MFVIVIKMIFIQILMWFVNVRRRLKKENKGEWNLDNLNNFSDEDNINDEIFVKIVDDCLLVELIFLQLEEIVNENFNFVIKFIEFVFLILLMNGEYDYSKFYIVNLIY